MEYTYTETNLEQKIQQMKMAVPVRLSLHGLTGGQTASNKQQNDRLHKCFRAETLVNIFRKVMNYFSSAIGLEGAGGGRRELVESG